MWFEGGRVSHKFVKVRACVMCEVVREDCVMSCDIGEYEFGGLEWTVDWTTGMEYWTTGLEYWIGRMRQKTNGTAINGWGPFRWQCLTRSDMSVTIVGSV